MPSLKRNLFRVYGANAISGLLGLGLVPYGVHAMGKAGYGLFSTYSVVFSFITLMESGLTKNLVRSLTSNRALDARINELQTAIGIYSVFSIILLFTLPATMIGIPAYIFKMSEEHLSAAGWIVLISVVEYIVAIPSSTILWYANADERFNRISKFTIVSSFYRYALIYTAVFAFGRPEVVVAFSACRRVVDFFVAKSIMGSLPSGSWCPKFKVTEMWHMLSNSAPLTLAQICVTSVNAVPSVLVSRYFGMAALGAYRAIFDLSNRVWFFSGGIGTVIFPRLVRLFSSEATDQDHQAPILASLSLSWTGYMSLALAGVGLGSVVLKVLNLASADYLALWAFVVMGVCMSAHAQIGFELLQATRMYRQLLLSTITALALMTAVPVSFGFLGLVSVGYAWLVSQFVYTLLLDSFSLQAIRSSIRQQWELLRLKIFSVSMPMAVIVACSMYNAVPLLVVTAAFISIGILQLRSLGYYKLLVANKP